MADPLSMVAKAIGLPSLGIQICLDLVSYLESIQGRHQAIADGLREVQTFQATLYSLHEILTRIDEDGAANLVALQQCLRSIEDKLMDLQRTLIKLRGDVTPSSKWDMEEARRSIIYPFCERKVKSLRQTLMELQPNLILAINIASLGLGMVSHKKVGDLKCHMQKHSDEMRHLQQSILIANDEAKEQLTQTQCLVKDALEDISGKLALKQTQQSSAELHGQIAAERLSEMFRRAERNSNIGLGMGIWISSLGNQLQRDQPISRYRQLQLDAEPQLLPHQNHDLLDPSRNVSLFKKAIPGQICSCPKDDSISQFSYSLLGMEIQLEQQGITEHRRGCRFYRIQGKVQRTMKARFPLKLAWFTTRMAVACIHYTTGPSSPGISLRYRSFVPRRQSPVYRELCQLGRWMRGGEIYYAPSAEIIERLNCTERAILSLYQDGISSPSDRDGNNRSHTTMLLDTVIRNHHLASRICSDYSVMATVIQMVQTLRGIVQADDDEIGRLSLYCLLRNYEERVEMRPVGERFLSYIFETFEIAPSEVFRIFNLYRNMRSTVMTFPDLIHKLEHSAIMRAIISKCLDDLDKSISIDSKAPLEKVFGYSAIQLCVEWPDGLKRLLETRAKSLLDDYGNDPAERPILRAIRCNCPDSVSILMNAGCSIIFDEDAAYTLMDASLECARVVAANLAQRRQDFGSFANKRLGELRVTSASEASAEGALSIRTILLKSHIAIPLHLDIGWDYENIYHFKGVPLHHFPTYFENGFQGQQSYNEIGLTPVMTWRNDTFDKDLSAKLPELRTALRWMETQGLLHQKPEDPLCLGLNVHATGFHYLAVMMGRNISFLNDWPISAQSITQDLSRLNVRDQCVCWCNPEGQGCHPIKTMWKSAIDERWRFEETRHLLFHCRTESGEREGEYLNLPMELVRLLTFEALDMEHTCCRMKLVDLPEKKCWSRSEVRTFTNSHHFPPVLASCDENETRAIRSDDLEQQNASMLDTLMKDFSKKMREMELSSFDLESFVWGYWRRRISTLFAVDARVLHEMEEHVGQVRTHVVSRRIVCILGEDFTLLTDKKRLNETDGKRGPDCSAEDDSWLRGCYYCHT